ncbi:PP2C family serine/threonine-protein phosphatase [Actinomyces sp. oral taxon 414]|jgi:serine/threonine protein phosphatase, 2C family|uniref:PP2C family protein-serine/threonine phosphatase n=1 Tax=Actinomyces sp. oral taxon 414 TaxID=712122 RepID=UPI0006AE0ABB|nr:protein phosphatase 2C domain-containing protein [Actinomyces sp. oral taxon 414]
MGRHSYETEQEPKRAPRLRVAHGGLTDIGLLRAVNEDAFLAEPPVFLVADGMGGHRAGDVAARAALDAFTDLVGQEFVTSGQLDAALARAAADVARLGDDVGAPGCTLTGLVLSLQGDLPCLHVVNVGDSRTYHFTRGVFSLVTRDHSEVQELIDAGRLTLSQARTSARRNVITRALGAGAGPVVPVDRFLLPAQAGDRFVICSDGLSALVSEPVIEAVVHSARPPRQVARELVDRALAAGGTDNVTVLIVDIIDVHPTWESVDVDDETLPLQHRASEDTLPRHRFVIDGSAVLRPTRPAPRVKDPS